MKAEWTGKVVGRMHIHGITYDELADEMGVGKAYISMILNESRMPADAEDRITKALDAIVARKEASHGS